MKFLKKWILKRRVRKALKEGEKEFDREIQKLLPAPQTQNAFEAESQRLTELNNDPYSSIREIEDQMDKIRELLAKDSDKAVTIFNPTLTERKNEELQDDKLLTREGTKKALEELTTYSIAYNQDFKRFHVNYDAKEHPLYWEI